jgi:flagellar basal-body rod protein FlgF
MTLADPIAGSRPARPNPAPKAAQTMENPSYIGLSHQLVLRDQMAVVAQNVANMNTPGFKAQRVLFQNFVIEADAAASRQGEARPLNMVIDQAVVRDGRAGALDRTGNPLDVALMGEGYLTVETPAGPRYTRNGRLSMDADRTLIDGNGLPVLDQGGQAIRIPEGRGDIEIAGDGTISADGEEVAQLGLARFADPAGLRLMGGNLLATNERPEPDRDTRIAQGMLERSNIQGAVEMTRMMEISRAYERAQTLIKSEDERQKKAIETLGKLS